MTDNEKRLKVLTDSLMQLNVSIAPDQRRNYVVSNLNVSKYSKYSLGDVSGLCLNIQTKKDDETNGNRDEDDNNNGQGQQSHNGVIANTAPIKSKITMAHSKMLTGLSDRATDSLLAVSKRNSTKVQIRFKSIGSIGQLRPAVFKISRSSRFLSILRFLTRRLKINNVYCYLENSIVPSPDDSIGNLYDLFKSGDSELIVSYCNIVAFG
ncbi:hypothetical protein HII12_002774 [Brettanomyces bruxellensis]|uniref:Ubiquitin-like protein ATG12 n=1 Tax=Dekkera bruxellensis TaxID=5007 RepID=A0A8H6BEX1_DEKBR|nr:hypothetical protein HII12_002774 [Brettanomyces bruxellensis]